MEFGRDRQRQSIQLRRGRKVHRNFRGRVQVVAHDFVANDDDGINQVFLRPAGGKKCLDQGLLDVAAFFRDALGQARQRVELGVEAGVSTSDFDDLLGGETMHFSEHGVGSQTILTFVDLADDEIDDLARFARDAAVRVLQCKVRGECGLRKGKRGVEIGNHPKTLFEGIENSLVVDADFFAGGNVYGAHGIAFGWLSNGCEIRNALTVRYTRQGGGGLWLASRPLLVG